VWVPHDVRDLVVDFVRRWSEKTEISAGRFIHWLTKFSYAHIETALPNATIIHGLALLR